MLTAPVPISRVATEEGVSGTLRYMADSIESSLFRNGRLFMKRDKDGSDSGMIGGAWAEKEVFVHNARLLEGEDRPTLDARGFEVVNSSVVGDRIDFLNHDDVIHRYYPQVAEVVRAATGAWIVAPFDHNVRSASGKNSKKQVANGQDVQGPAHIVHGDLTITSSEDRIRALAKPPLVNDTLRSVLGDKPLLNKDDVDKAIAEGRWAVINLWRNIADEPVQVNPLAMCDAASVGTDELIVFEIHYADRIGENYVAKHSDKHKWYYYPQMTKDEALLLKTWDSAGRLAKTRGASADAGSKSGEPCTFSFHSAFTDPSTPDDAPDRWSIEVRCAVLY